MSDDTTSSNDDRRQGWRDGPEGEVPRGWLALSDDELLYTIEALPAGHDHDRALLEVIRSTRHFFIRQEAAKKIRDAEHLKAHSGDRHIGQILVRAMTRAADEAYLEKLIVESRHIEVKKAAEAQLRQLRAMRRSREGR